MGANVLLLFNSRHTKNYEKRERENGCSLFSLWYVAPSPSSSLVFHKRIGQEWLEYHRLLEFVVVRKSTRRELKLNQQQEKVERERASKCIPCLLFLSTADESVCVCLCLLFPLTVSCRHRRFSLKKDTKRNVKAFLYSVVCVRDQNKRERERERRQGMQVSMTFVFFFFPFFPALSLFVVHLTHFRIHVLFSYQNRFPSSLGLKKERKSLSLCESRAFTFNCLSTFAAFLSLYTYCIDVYSLPLMQDVTLSSFPWFFLLSFMLQSMEENAMRKKVADSARFPLALHSGKWCKNSCCRLRKRSTKEDKDVFLFLVIPWQSWGRFNAYRCRRWTRHYFIFLYFDQQVRQRRWVLGWE